MIIDCISDLHGELPELQGGDLLIIAGDLTGSDKVIQWKNFYLWLDNQKYDQIVYIAGNHDGLLYTSISSKGCRALLEKEDWPKDNIEYLRDNSFMYKGLKIYGMPWTPTFCRWYFMKDRKGMREMAAKIPEDVDILISHGPPYKTLDQVEFSSRGDKDRYAGCKELAKHLKSLKQLKLHVFGHIHESYGVRHQNYEIGDETVIPGGYVSVNASIMNGDYDPVNPPIRLIVEEKPEFQVVEIRSGSRLIYQAQSE